MFLYIYIYICCNGWTQAQENFQEYFQIFCLLSLLSFTFIRHRHYCYRQHAQYLFEFFLFRFVIAKYC